MNKSEMIELLTQTEAQLNEVKNLLSRDEGFKGNENERLSSVNSFVEHKQELMALANNLSTLINEINKGFYMSP